ncbi:hypothetical protein ACQPYH_04205 [Kribbella sp. CA-245084]|uniref:hypothetical protein n=1 Tax=Kribbella sp. CA-245084 TaxID=3239940 RepID=UPI003D93E466
MNNAKALQKAAQMIDSATTEVSSILSKLHDDVRLLLDEGAQTDEQRVWAVYEQVQASGQPVINVAQFARDHFPKLSVRRVQQYVASFNRLQQYHGEPQPQP